MSCLDATFTLTPTTPWYHPVFSSTYANLSCYGADFPAHYPYDFSTLYSRNQFYFDSDTAADLTVDYSQWANRRKVPFIELSMSLWSTKQLALIFGFQAVIGRVLVYNDARQIGDQTFGSMDNQFLLEIDSTMEPLNIYFIHAGGSWSFNGISGYLV